MCWRMYMKTTSINQSFVGSEFVSGGDEFVDDSFLGAAVSGVWHDDKFCILESLFEIESRLCWADDIVSSLNDDSRDMCDLVTVVEKLIFV